MRSHWRLDPEVVFLNHGSFGACPRVVLEEQSRLRAQLEAEPVRFMVHEREPLLAEARRVLAAFVGAAPEDVAFVRNATEGCNAVLRSLHFERGDEILVTSHGYHAVSNCARFVASRAGAKVVVAEVPFPIASEDEALEAILGAVTARTKLAVVDHVTSPTGLVLPIARVVTALEERGVDTLVDGAHAPGMVPLDLSGLGAAYYTGNLHKHCCAPKGAALLHVRRDRQEGVHPPVISHGFDSPRDRSRFLEEMDWTGTADPSAWLSVPKALEVLAELGGGWEALRARCRGLALEGRRILMDALGVPEPAPESMVGFLGSVPLPDASPAPSRRSLDPLQLALYERHRIEVPIAPWPAAPKRLVRISAHLYNQRSEYVALAEALNTELSRASGG